MVSLNLIGLTTYTTINNLEFVHHVHLQVMYKINILSGIVMRIQVHPLN
jgi:hypothetical protein